MNPRVLEHLRTAGEHCDEWQLNAKGEQAASEDATGYTASKSARRAVSGGEAHRSSRSERKPSWRCSSVDIRGAVKWKGTHRNMYKRADCLIGWEAEMQKVDEECERRALLPNINPALEAQNQG